MMVTIVILLAFEVRATVFYCQLLNDISFTELLKRMADHSYLVGIWTKLNKKVKAIRTELTDCCNKC